MTTFRRICIKDFAVTDGESTASVERGTEYLTSAADDSGEVTVFATFWFGVPVSHFGGARQFT